MAAGKIKTLYSNKEKTEPLFPKTKLNAISDENGVGLEAIMQSLAYTDGLSQDASAPLTDADSLGGRPASEYATELYVKQKIAEASAGEIDLSDYALKTEVMEEIGKIDFPVDSINGKTGVVQLSATDVGALPSGGGQMTGALDVNGGVIMWKDTEGGNIDIFPPSANTLTNHWEIDSHNGELRFYVDRKNTNPNGSGIITPLRLLTDGSIEVYAKTKTLENLGAAPASHATDKNNPHGVTAAQAGAIAATSKSLGSMSVKDWAASLTSSAWGYTNTSTTDMPVEISASNNYAIATANVVASGGWIELRLRYVVTGCEAVAIYNYGWGEWEWVNPPMIKGVEYRTTERYNDKPVYTKLVDCGNGPNNYYKTVNIGETNVEQYIYCSIFCDYPAVFPLGGNDHTTDFQYGGILGDQIKIISQVDATGDHFYAIVKYTKK